MTTGTAVLAGVAEWRRIANDERIAGRYAPAEAILLAAAIDAVSAACGVGDVTVAVLRNDLAVTYRYAGRLDDAEARYWLALPALESALGPQHPEVATVWHNLGGIRHARGDLACAERFARRGLQIRAAALGDSAATTKPKRCSPRPLLCSSLGSAPTTTKSPSDCTTWRRSRSAGGDLEAAKATALRSLELRAAVLGGDHPELASTLNNLAAIHRAQGRHATAADYRRALELLAGTVDERHPALSAVRAGLADVHAESTAATETPRRSRQRARPNPRRSREGDDSRRDRHAVLGWVRSSASPSFCRPVRCEERSARLARRGRLAAFPATHRSPNRGRGHDEQTRSGAW